MGSPKIEALGGGAERQRKHEGAGAQGSKNCEATPLLCTAEMDWGAGKVTWNTGKGNGSTGSTRIRSERTGNGRQRRWTPTRIVKLLKTRSLHKWRGSASTTTTLTITATTIARRATTVERGRILGVEDSLGGSRDGLGDLGFFHLK